MDIRASVSVCNLFVTMGHSNGKAKWSNVWHVKVRQEGELHVVLAAVAVAADDAKNASRQAQLEGRVRRGGDRDVSGSAWSPSVLVSPAAHRSHSSTIAGGGASIASSGNTTSGSRDTVNHAVAGTADWFPRLLQLVAVNDFAVVEEVLRVVQPHLSTDVGATGGSGDDNVADGLRLAQALLKSHSRDDLRRLLVRVSGVATVVRFLVGLLDMVVANALVGANAQSAAADAPSKTGSGDTAMWLLCQLCDVEWEQGACRGAGVHKMVRVRVERWCAGDDCLVCLDHIMRRCRQGVCRWLAAAGVKRTVDVAAVANGRMMFCGDCAKSPTVPIAHSWCKLLAISCSCAVKRKASRCRCRPCPSCSSCGHSMATSTSSVPTRTLRRTVQRF